MTVPIPLLNIDMLFSLSLSVHLQAEASGDATAAAQAIVQACAQVGVDLAPVSQHRKGLYVRMPQCSANEPCGCRAVHLQYSLP